MQQVQPQAMLPLHMHCISSQQCTPFVHLILLLGPLINEVNLLLSDGVDERAHGLQPTQGVEVHAASVLQHLPLAPGRGR
jgi:hypothetical protein